MKLLNNSARLCLVPVRFCGTGCKRTALHDFHVQSGAKMVPFAGFSMPVQYKQSIKESHLFTRSHASLFDVSHMLQTKVLGKDRVNFMESLTVADVKGLKCDHSALSLFTNSSGGIEDDLILTQASDYLFVVSNAGRIDNDKKLMESQVAQFRGQGLDVQLEYLAESHSLLALQGPMSQNVLQKLVQYDLSTHKFMTSRVTELRGVGECRVSRCGYTGEDGFEISVPNESAERLAHQLLGPDVWLAGLGARDSLRLEAGLCLYGNDMDDKTTPVEAGLVWTIGKARRTAADFPGADIILKQIREKPKRRRIGLVARDAGPAARQGTQIQVNGQEVGVVTSGCPSPSLSKNIAMAYVQTSVAVVGHEMDCMLRAKKHPYTVTKMPFLPSKYFV